MSEYVKSSMPAASRALSDKAAIVGIGETDFAKDYQAARSKPPGYIPPTPERLSVTAFERALADSGLRRGDIDGISVSYIYGGPPPQEMASLLGLQPRYAISNGNIMAGPLPVVCADIAAGKADTVAMIYAAASRAIGRQYGGQTYTGDQTGTPSSYYYYHPWGWSSQAAHWAMVCTYYLNQFGLTEDDLAQVAIRLRENAALNPNAIMRTPLTLEAYRASRYIVRPLHLLDMCLVNDGAVCLIVRKADLARDLAHKPVLISGWGEAAVKQDKMHMLIRERLRPQIQDSVAQALTMADAALSEIGHFEGYDAASMHLITQLEGCGFAEPGTALHGFRAGDFGVHGRLPVNTAGGMISGAYMHGWNHVVEVVRQLRHEAGARQIKDLQMSLACLAQTDASHPILYRRGR
jgi:acetyl-CoA acetyltransferase